MTLDTAHYAFPKDDCIVNRSTPPLPSSPRLPTECCERIIDLIAVTELDFRYLMWPQGVLGTLRACSLTCRAWTPRSQFHIYRIFGISCSAGDNLNLESFVSMLDRHGALRTYVTAVIGKAGLDDNPTLHILPLKLPRLLTHLRHLRLANGIFYPPPGAVFDVSMRQFSTVAELSLDRVTFQSVHDMRRIVSALRSLSKLELWCPSWRTTPPTVVSSPSRSRMPARLVKLCIHADADWVWDYRSVYFVEWLANSGALTSLRQLNLGGMMICNEAMFRVVEIVLRVAKESLKYLGLSCSPEVHFSRLHAALSCCRKLEGLYLVLPCHTATFKQLIGLLASLTCKEIMKLRLWFNHYAVKSCPEPDVLDWERLDRILQKRRYNSLRRVVVSRFPKAVRTQGPIVWGKWYDDAPFNGNRWCEQVKAFLPLIHKRRILWYWPGPDSHAVPVPTDLNSSTPMTKSYAALNL